MDPISQAAAASRSIAEGGFTTFLIFIVMLQFVALRWVFLKYDAARQSQVDDGKMYGGALKEAADAIDESNKLLLSQAVDIGKLKLQFDHWRSSDR